MGHIVQGMDVSREHAADGGGESDVFVREPEWGALREADGFGPGTWFLAVWMFSPWGFWLGAVVPRFFRIGERHSGGSSWW